MEWKLVIRQFSDNFEASSTGADSRMEYREWRALLDRVAAEFTDGSVCPKIRGASEGSVVCPKACNTGFPQQERPVSPSHPCDVLSPCKQSQFQGR
jgi:hypothetical protein